MLTVNLLTLTNMDFPLNERVKLARELSGHTHQSLADKIGIKREAVSAWESGNTKSINSAHLHKAADALGVDSRWLATGEGQMRLADEGVLEMDFVEIPTMNGVKASAGNGYLPDYVEIKGGHAYRRSDLEKLGIKPETAFRMKIDMHSMEPTLFHGDWVLVDGADKNIQSDKVFVFTVRGEVRVKRFRWAASDKLEVISDNHDKLRYPTEILTPEEAEYMQANILGRVRDRSGRGNL